MKKLLLFACLAVAVVFAGPVHADNWVLAPTGSVDTSALAPGTTVSVNLYFNYDGGMSPYFANMDLDFVIDLAEVTPALAKSGNPDVTWAIAGQATIATQIVGNTVSYAAGNLGGYNTWAAGSQLVATMPLLTVGSAQPWDGAGDFDLLPQIGTANKGIFDYYGNINQYGGVTGPDYGAIPIPGAIYLLASGFLGLIGLRRKFR
jgi:hypothetical protein